MLTKLAHFFLTGWGGKQQSVINRLPQAVFRDRNAFPSATPPPGRRGARARRGNWRKNDLLFASFLQ